MTELNFYFEIFTYFIFAFAYFNSKFFSDSALKFEVIFRNLSNMQFIIFSFAFIILYSSLIICDGHNWGGDFSQYLAQTRAIITGDINFWLDKQSFIIEHSTPGFAPLIYPWGTALILLPIYKIFGLNFVLFKLFEALFFFGTVVVFFLFLRLKFDSYIAAITAAFILFNVNYLIFTDNILSDLPCLFFSMLTILLIYKRNLAANYKILYGFLIGTTIFFSVQMRSISLALIVALAADDILSIIEKNFQKNKIIARAVPYIVFGIFSIALSTLLPNLSILNNTGYLVKFSFNPLDAVLQIKNYLFILGEFIFPFNKNIFGAILTIFCIILAVTGMITKINEDRFLCFYFLTTICVLIFFNTLNGIRLAFGVFPILIYFSVAGINYLLQRTNKLKKKNICRGIAFTILSSFLLFSIICARISDRNTAFSNEAVEVYNFINQNISDDKVIYFFKPRVLYFNTNVYSYGAVGDIGAEDLYLADYILLTKYDWYRQLKELTKNSTAYELIFENKKFKLYKINR